MSKFLKFLLTRVVMTAMAVSFIAPYVPLASADPVVPTGTLIVRTNLDEGNYQVRRANSVVTIASGSGMGPNSHVLPQGLYDVVFGAVPDYTAPVRVDDIMIISGAVIELPIANYVLSDFTPTGTIQMTTNNENASYFIQVANGGAEMATGTGIGPNTHPLPQGLYDVTFNAVDGYVTPAAVEDQMVINGGLLELTGLYRPLSGTPTGTLRVTVNHDEATYDIREANSDTVAVTGTGAGPTDHLLPQGLYDVEFNEVEGYVTPAAVTDVMVTDGDISTAEGIYNLLGSTPTGTIRVTTNNDAAVYTIRVANSSGIFATGSGVGPNEHLLVPGGIYDVVFDDVPGYVTPAMVEDVLVTAGEISDVYGNYTLAAGTGSVVVNVTNERGERISDGAWSLNSCSGTALTTCIVRHSNGSASATMVDVPTSRYGLAFKLTSAYQSVVLLSENPQTLLAGDTIVFNLQYSTRDVLRQLTMLRVSTVCDQGELGPDLVVAGGVILVTDGRIVSTETAPHNFVVDTTRANALQFTNNVPNCALPVPVAQIYPPNTLPTRTTDVEGRYTTELAEVRVTAQEADGTLVNNATIKIGPDGAATEFFTADANPVVTNVNVADDINQVTCGLAPGYRILTDVPIPVTAAAGTADNNYTCLYEQIRTTALAVTARLEEADPGIFEERNVDLFQGVYPDGVLLAGGETNADGSPQTFGDLALDIAENYYLVFEDFDPANYLTPRTPGDPVYVLPVGSLEEGVPEAVNGVYLPLNARITVTVSGLDAGEAATVLLYEGPDESGEIIGDQSLADGATFTFIIPDPAGQTFTVTCESPLEENPDKLARARVATFLLTPGASFTHACDYVENASRINVLTQPIPARVQLLVNTDAFDSETSVLAPGAADIYEMTPEDRFVVPITDPAPELQVNFYSVPGNPATGVAYRRPAPIAVTDPLIAGETITVGPGIYTETDEKEFLNIHTLGADDAAIYVDGIEVRPSGSDEAVTIPIATEDTHVVSFGSADGYFTPAPIAIPAGNLEDRRGTTRNILGYYVEIGQEHDFYIRVRNRAAEAFILVNEDPTPYYIGYVNLADPLVYRVDVRNKHGIVFQDHSPEYVMRQSRFNFEDGTLPVGDATTVIGRYILAADAAYFRAIVRNADPAFYRTVSLDITADGIGETILLPMTGNMTETFVADVRNDENAIRFVNPITVGGEDFVPFPARFDLTAGVYPPGQPIGVLGSRDNPYNLTTEYLGTATVEVRVIGDEADTVALDATETTSTVPDGGTALFERVPTGAEHVITCGRGTSGLTETPEPIYISADGLSAGTNTFTCLYVPTATSARITVRTTAVDDPDLSAPITLNVDGVDFNMGFTRPGADPSAPATLQLRVDAARTNRLEFEDVAGYANPLPIPVDAPAGSTDRVYTGTYVLSANAAYVTINTRLSDTGALTDSPVDNIGFNLIPVGRNTYETLIDRTTIDTSVGGTPIEVSFVDSLAGYAQPVPYLLDQNLVQIGVNEFTSFYVPEVSAAFIAVNTVGAEGEIFLNGTSVGRSVGEAYRGAFLIDTDRAGGNVIAFGPVAGFSVFTPILIPQGQDGLSAVPAAPTRFTGVYVPNATAATLGILALESDTSDTVTGAEIRVDGNIVGYGEALLTVNAGLHTVSFGDVTDFVTPLDIPVTLAAGEEQQVAGFYIPDTNAYRTVTIRTVDDIAPANALMAPIRFSIDDGDNVYFVGTGVATLNIDETVDSNVIFYNTAFTNAATGESYALVTPADGTEELAAPYSAEYLGVYHLIPVAFADLTTVDDDNDALAGVPDAAIFVNGALAGTQRVIGYEFVADVPTEVSFGTHPADPTYNTPLPIFFTPINGRTYPPIPGTYTHSCQVNVVMTDATGNPIEGEVTMRTDRDQDGSIMNDPDFFYGTGAPGTGVVSIVLDETRLNEITVNPPVPNPDGLTPDPSTINIPAGSLDPATECPADFDVIFRIVDNNAFINIITTSDMGADPAGATISLNGTVVSDADGNIVSLPVDVRMENTFTFGPAAGFLSPLPLVIRANALTVGSSYTFPAVYITPGEEATLRLQARDSTDPLLRIGAAISLITNGGAAALQGFDDAEILVNINNAYAVLWGAVTDYLTPAINPTPVSPALTQGEIRPMVGSYVPCVNCRAVTVRAMNTNGTPALADDTVLAGAAISINGVGVGAGEVTRFFPVGTPLDIAFGTVPGFETPVLEFVRPTIVSASLDPTENLFIARYAPTTDYVFTFNAEDSSGVSLNAFSRVAVDGGAFVPLPLNLTTDDVTDRMFVYMPVLGFATDAVLAFAGPTFTVPDNIRIVENDGAGTMRTYTEGDSITLRTSPFRYTVTGIYQPQIRVTKTVNNTVVNNREVVQYVITVERLTDLGPRLNIEINDSLTGVNSLPGNNGGRLDYILNSTQLSGVTLAGANCGLGSLQVSEGTIECALDMLGSTARVVYDLRADNSSIPVRQTSVVDNLATVTVTDLGFSQNSASTVTINGPEPAPVITGGGGPGGGPAGNGGSHIMFTGNMELMINSSLSLDGETFFDATQDQAIRIPENQTSTLRVKVRISNPNPFTATAIAFRHSFDFGESDMTASEPKNLQGARFDKKFGTIVVEKVESNKTIEFTYELDIHENGQSSELAENKLTLVHFGSALPIYQDGLTYVTGEELLNYLVAGMPAGRASESEPLANGVPSLEVSASYNPGLGRIGQLITLTVMARNTGNVDLTNLVINHDYNEQTLNVSNAMSAENDGDSLTWNVARLRPGQKALFKAELLVATISGSSQGITDARADQISATAPITSTLSLLPGQPYQLAQTGALSVLWILLMIAAAALGFHGVKKYQYVTLKKLALEPV